MLAKCLTNPGLTHCYGVTLETLPPIQGRLKNYRVWLRGKTIGDIQATADRKWWAIPPAGRQAICNTRTTAIGYLKER